MDNKLLHRVASNDKVERDRAVRAIHRILRRETADKALPPLLWQKLWKALFYCVWMSDKREVQNELTMRLANLWLDLPTQAGLAYYKAFWITMKREWEGIDRLRLDKYYLLLRHMYTAQFAFLKQHEEDREVCQSIVTILSEHGPLSTSDTTPLGLTYHFLDNFEAYLNPESSEEEEEEADEQAHDEREKEWHGQLYSAILQLKLRKMVAKKYKKQLLAWQKEKR